MKALLQKIKDYFENRKSKKRIEKYIGSIERDERGRWVFSKDEKVAELPPELLGNKDWIEFKRIVGDKKTWQPPCTCGDVDGECEC